MAIDAEFRPRLRHCTLIEDASSGITTLVVGRDHFSLECQGDRKKFLELKSWFDGRHSISEIAVKTGLPVQDVFGVVDTFISSGLLQQREAEGRIAVADFTRRVEESSLMWRRQIGLHQLFGGLAEGLYRQEVLLGLLIEAYHYVRLLPRVLAAVAPQMEDSSFRRIVAEYALEEMDHHLEYRKSLLQVDRIARHLETAHPTVGTLSLIRNFESVGRRSELSLVCCLQLIEARRSEMDAAEQDLRKIAGKYGYEHLIEPFVSHMRADVDLAHAGILDSALGQTEWVAANDAHVAVNDMHDIKHAFDAFHDSIVQYYGDISNYIPRPTVDYFAL